MQPANRFKLARVRLGLTQEEVARRAAIPVPYLVAVENSRSVKRKLAAVLGIMPLRDDDEESRSTGSTNSTEGRREPAE